MSLLHNAGIYQSTNKTADRKHSDYAFLLGLVCTALALVVASVAFTPASVGGVIPLVGP